MNKQVKKAKFNKVIFIIINENEEFHPYNIIIDSNINYDSNNIKSMIFSNYVS